MSAKNFKYYYGIIYSRLLAFTPGFYPPAFSNNKNGRHLGARKNSHLTSAKTFFFSFEGMDGWMTCDFTSFSTVFQSLQDDVRMIMERFHLE